MLGRTTPVVDDPPAFQPRDEGPSASSSTPHSTARKHLVKLAEHLARWPSPRRRWARPVAVSMAAFCLLCVLTGIAAGSGVLIVCGLVLLSVALGLFRRTRRTAALSSDRHQAQAQRTGSQAITRGEGPATASPRPARPTRTRRRASPSANPLKLPSRYFTPDRKDVDPQVHRAQISGTDLSWSWPCRWSGPRHREPSSSAPRIPQR